jgi:hypothetical protein
MSHTGTMKWALHNEHAQAHPKSANTLIIKTWEVLNPICHVLLEEGCQKYKRPSYMAKFEREVAQCKEEKGNWKAAVMFEVYESNVCLWWKHKAPISECEASQKEFTRPKKG